MNQAAGRSAGGRCGVEGQQALALRRGRLGDRLLVRALPPAAGEPARNLDLMPRPFPGLHQKLGHAPVAGGDRMIGRLQGRVEG